MNVYYDPEFVLHLLQYMTSTDRAGLEAARRVSEEEYYKDRGFSFGSIHNLLVHQLVAQKTWLRRFRRVAAREAGEPDRASDTRGTH